MDTLTNQIKELENKVSSLHQLVERIGERVNVLSERKTPISSPYSFGSFDRQNDGNGSEQGEQAYSIAHKDILSDDTRRDRKNPTQEKDLAPEIQIRRLTAQLTAAYNRIAALEEQLLTYRVKS